MTTVTRKAIETQLRKELPRLRQFDLVRAPEGYFYAVGTAEDAGHFITGGVYVYRLGRLSVDQWVSELKEKIETCLVPFDSAVAELARRNRIKLRG